MDSSKVLPTTSFELQQKRCHIYLSKTDNNKRCAKCIINACGERFVVIYTTCT